MPSKVKKALEVSSEIFEGVSIQGRFDTLCKFVCETLAADCTFISEVQRDNINVTLSVFAKNTHLGSIRYSSSNKSTHTHEFNELCARIQAKLTNDVADTVLKPENCISTTLLDHQGRKIGTLGAIFTSLPPNLNECMQSLRVFSLGASSELERIHYEKLLTQQITNLEEQSDRLTIAQSIYDHASDAIIITDEHNRIVYGNPALLEQTGFHYDEILGESPKMFSSKLQSPNFYRELWQSLQATGVWRGELVNRRKDGRLYMVFSAFLVIRDHEGKIRNHLAIQKDITDEKQNRELIEFQANYDSLTGLNNRTSFLKCVSEQLQNYPACATLLIIDLDNFKDINDYKGHNIGDSVLRAFTRKLRLTFAKDEVLARVGGDEFAIFTRLDSPQALEELTTKIKSQLNGSLKVSGGGLQYVSISIGVALHTLGKTNSEHLYAQADYALNQAKYHGKNAIEHYRPELRAKSLRRRKIIELLPQAIFNGEIRAHFQPIFSIATEKVTHCEALARWEDSVLGPIYPDEFIPIAEESGLMLSLGQCITQQAIKLVTTLNQQRANPIRVSINRSAQEFTEETEELDSWAKLAEKNNFPTELIIIELTESIMIGQPEIAKLQMDKLRMQGFTLAMDDFGTGYSSLSYLRQLPFSILKIDRAFIADMHKSAENYALVKAIIELAKTFGMSVVAEGVEDEQQFSLLQNLHCDYVQGFFMSQVLTAEEFLEFMNGTTRGSNSAPTRNKFQA